MSTTSDITKTHPQHRKYLPLWKRCRDVIEGSDAVKGGRELYLKRLPGQSHEAYEIYLERALFFNITGKTLELYLSMIFSKAATIHGLAADSPLLLDCDLQGTTLEEFLEDVTTETISVGRCGVLVDYSGTIQSGMSLADAAREEARPYLVRYPAESITNWHMGRHGGKTVLDRAVLRERKGDEDDDTFQYRELILLDETYTVRIWQKSARTTEEHWYIEKTMVPKLNGKPLTALPFYFIDAISGSADCKKPPLLDLVDINLGHYRTIADLEHGRLHSGLATPIFAGFNFQEGEQIKLGSTEGIHSNMPDAKAYYLEFTGQGLGALEKAAEQKEAWMIQLGAGLIDSYQHTQEAAQTLMIRRAGANASVGRIAMAISETMTKAFSFLCEWAGMNTRDFKIQLTTEYLPESMDPQEIAILLQAVQSGNYRRIDWLYRLKNAGIISQETKPEKIDEELSGHPMGFHKDAA
jgi:hypothetical protein